MRLKLSRDDMVRSGVEFVGLAMVAIGLWWVWPPACLIVVGSAILAGSLATTIARRRKR